MKEKNADLLQGTRDLTVLQGLRSRRRPRLRAHEAAGGAAVYCAARRDRIGAARESGLQK